MAPVPLDIDLVKPTDKRDIGRLVIEDGAIPLNFDQVRRIEKGQYVVSSAIVGAAFLASQASLPRPFVLPALPYCWGLT